jgi:hypothetical protein
LCLAPGPQVQPKVIAADPVRGILIAPGRSVQVARSAATDGAVLVAWEDSRDQATLGSDIYFQRVLADGGIGPEWPTNGLPLCRAPGYQQDPALASDGTGGAIVAWTDWRGAGANADIYAQRVDAFANRPWLAHDGTPISTAPHSQRFPALIGDGAGGAIVTWEDARSDSTLASDDIYAQRIDATGFTGGSNPNTPETIGFSMYPNPASGSVELTLPADGQTYRVSIFDLFGREIWRDDSAPGLVNLRWNGVDRDGRQVASGLYLVRFSARGQSTQRRLVWLR